MITCTSANPRSQRSGSGTFFSTTAPSMVVTASSSSPTARCSGSEPPTRARASRSGPFTSTFVVPRSCTSPSIAASRTSSRAYTPPHAENDSSRSRSPLQVTTGSRNPVGRGRWYRVWATSASPISAAAAGAACVRTPLKKCGCGRGPLPVVPPDVDSPSRPSSIPDGRVYV
ncbi:hypothetical protein [Actinomadura sp. CNU-125]|uniref:hypothetical protein n=1 Tax=Actinomadura sp. CNU-125 TaxID=1904961 RepID=UPI0021CCCFA1|nr:hypothetical protein [Actinomadura sp. CNU-125]